LLAEELLGNIISVKWHGYNLFKSIGFKAGSYGILQDIILRVK